MYFKCKEFFLFKSDFYLFCLIFVLLLSIAVLVRLQKA